MGTLGNLGHKVDALTVYGGELVAGGIFPSSGVTTLNDLGRWNGTVWQPFVVPGPPAVHALATWNGELVAAAQLSINRWNGAAWTNISPPPFYGSLFDFEGSLMVTGGWTPGGINSPHLARYSSPLPRLRISQPAGPGTGVEIANFWTIPGHEYYNIASLNPCPGGVGSGPYGGLCFNNPADLVTQALLPIGAVPFHYVAGGTSAVFGPFPLPAGLAFEAITVDVTGGVIGCLSPVRPYTVN